MKVAGRRAALCPLRIQSILRWSSAYSDTAAVTSCSIAKSVREVVNCNKLNKVFPGTS